MFVINRMPVLEPSECTDRLGNRITLGDYVFLLAPDRVSNNPKFDEVAMVTGWGYNYLELKRLFNDRHSTTPKLVQTTSLPNNVIRINDILNSDQVRDHVDELIVEVKGKFDVRDPSEKKFPVSHIIMNFSVDGSGSQYANRRVVGESVGIFQFWGKTADDYNRLRTYLTRTLGFRVTDHIARRARANVWEWGSDSCTNQSDKFFSMKQLESMGLDGYVNNCMTIDEFNNIAPHSNLRIDLTDRKWQI